MRLVSAELRSRDGDAAVVAIDDGRGGEELLTLPPPYSNPQFLPDIGETVTLAMSGPVPMVMPRQIAVDSISVRELKAGTVSALLLIGDQIIAGDRDENHVDIRGDGVRVYAFDTEAGQYLASQWGTSFNDFWAITTAAGVSVASISSSGSAQFSALSSTMWPQIGTGDWTGIGGSLDAILDRRPRGLVGYGTQIIVAPGTTQTNTVNGIGFFEIVLDLLPGRQYKLCTSDISLRSTVAGDVVRLRVLQTTAERGTLPLSAGVDVGNLLAGASGVAGTDVTLAQLLFSIPVPVTTRLLLTYARESGTGLVNVAGREGSGDVCMWVEDVGPYQGNRAVLNDGGSNGLGGAGGTPQAPPVSRTLTVDGAWSNTYNGSGIRDADATALRQGFGAGGDRRSMVGFRELVELNGATIQSVVLRLNARTWLDAAGGVGVIGFHNKLVKPTEVLTGMIGITADQIRQSWSGKGAGFIDLTALAPQEWATGAKRGIFIGIAQGLTDPDTAINGAFNGPLATEPNVQPQLTITYTI